MRALSLRTLEATVTPGVFASARPAATGNTPASALPLCDTMWPARICVFRESANELRARARGRAGGVGFVWGREGPGGGGAGPAPQGRHERHEREPDHQRGGGG